MKTQEPLFVLLLCKDMWKAFQLAESITDTRKAACFAMTVKSGFEETDSAWVLEQVSRKVDLVFVHNDVEDGQEIIDKLECPVFRGNLLEFYQEMGWDK